MADREKLTIADIEREAAELAAASKGASMKIGEWIAERMRDAVTKSRAKSRARAAEQEGR